ncbi:MAG TPA: protein translocase subunit SecD [Candidatus Paceibacterota bacterium]|nr:protein translocase subunit SecD [Candidatus Pacearchaeota archaeon]HRZ50655.1 protein translocase subunit SecD [Candidatus Paceibacterota bacterium]HSA36448.1 protein translocase subunit SecD [Candidatus Paceibacterota bacterium]
MLKKHLGSLILIVLLAVVSGIYCVPQYVNGGINSINAKYNWKLAQINAPDFKLGLDVKGGVRLEYQADLSKIEESKRDEVMEGLKDLIERRINVYGVAEPQIQTSGESRLIVELPGVESVQQAIEWIGSTPWLEFKEQRPQEETDKIIAKIQEVQGKTMEEAIQIPDYHLALENPYFKNTELTGEYLSKAALSFDQNTGSPIVDLQFNDEGAKIFEQITERNVGKPMAIYLDGQSIIDTNGDDKIDNSDIYAPNIQQKITGGKAIITGITDVTEAKTIVKRLNEGALPVPLGQPISQQKIGPTLGAISLDQTLKAGFIGFLIVILFMIVYYRVPGILASVALTVYIGLLLAMFKLISVTMSLAGIGGFILSVGMAVDANVLIFSRLKEELESGKSLASSIEEAFNRAWPAIRDGNFTTVVVGIILFIFGTSFVKGFATTLNIGIMVSMFSAIVVTKTFLRLFVGTKLENVKWLWKPLA